MMPAPGVDLSNLSSPAPAVTLAAERPEPTAMQRAAAVLVSKVRTLLTGYGELSQNRALALKARMTPVDDAGRPRDSRDVRLRALNERGLAFEHPAPLADRRALLTIECADQGALAAEVELSWCRYIEGGGYASGGRFVRLFDPPQ